jgi:hypothetical protein
MSCKLLDSPGPVYVNWTILLPQIAMGRAENNEQPMINCVLCLEQKKGEKIEGESVVSFQ